MGRKIKITESALNRIKEQHRLTEYEFIQSVKSYIQGLVEDGANVEYPFQFIANGINKEELDELLEKEGLILKSEKIKDEDENGKKIKPRLNVSYLVSKTNPKIKIQKIYNLLFDEEGERITEEATTACSSGAYVGKAFMTTPIKMINYITKK